MTSTEFEQDDNEGLNEMARAIEEARHDKMMAMLFPQYTHGIRLTPELVEAAANTVKAMLHGDNAYG
jgi:hypothetical protein